jgi:hypothetical protein
MSALPFRAASPLTTARQQLEAASEELAHARAVLADAVLAAELAEAEHADALVAWGRARDAAPRVVAARDRRPCPLCGKSVALRTSDGRVRGHGDATGTFCRGSGRVPAAATPPKEAACK